MPRKPTYKEMALIIQEHFTPSPAVRAAKVLYDRGVRERNIKLENLCMKPLFITEPIALSVLNALRDIERKNRDKI
jgi:hypothetical protein